jgi:stage III sporulation protein AD
MQIWNICGIALLCVFSSLIIKECNGKLFSFIGIFFAVFVMFLLVNDLSKIYGFMNGISENGNLSPYLLLILKLLSLGYAISFTSDICREMGEVGIASKLELLGRIEMIALCLPEISEIMSIAISIMDK